MTTIYSFQEELKRASRKILLGSFLYTFFVAFLVIFFSGYFFIGDLLVVTVVAAILTAVLVCPTFYFAYRRPIDVMSRILRARDPNLKNPNEKKVYEVFDNMRIAYGTKNVELKILPWNVINAMVISTKDKSVVFVTKGAAEKLDYYELEAVLAHEFAHIKNRDSYYMTLIAVVGSIALLLAWFLMRVVPRILMEMASGDREEEGGAGVLIAAAVASFVLGVILYIATPFIFLKLMSSLSKRREYLADSTAVEITKNPPAMISVLLKVAKEDTSEFVEKMKIPKNVNALLFDYEDFETHPRIWERIKAICETTGTPLPEEFEELKRKNI